MGGRGAELVPSALYVRLTVPLRLSLSEPPFMLEQQPQRGASHFPLIALACTVVLAAVLPIAAATAGPAGSSEEGKGLAPSASSAPSRGAAERPGAGAFEASDAIGGRSGRSTGVPEGASVASCGDELTSPAGLTAQTCVMSQRDETWARTYYRNATRSPLRAALTLTRPDGGSVRADCALPASGRRGTCETPHEENRGGGERPYAATAEVGSADGARMLLRSESNSSARRGS